jgi:histidyl-tRNA synthetase
MFKRIPGTKDILPEEAYRWQELERVSRRIFSLYNYQEIRLPLIEDAVLFNRSLGDFAEVVQKQMFIIRNKEDVYALRPEGTASVVRAYIENSLDKTRGFMKLFYLGPMFRLERPQKGRMRQFHHIGCETIGAAGPQIDIEVISLAHRLLEAFGISGHILKLNTLGCSDDKMKLSGVVREKLSSRVTELCEECRERLEHNVLRILDCKQEGCRQVVKSLGMEAAHVCPECAAHFAAVKQGLTDLRVPFEIAPHLVRGLDYYTRTVFEFTHGNLGAQDAIGAGGRYDKLVEELGGPQAGCVGFAFGVERLLLALGDASSPQAPSGLVYVIPLGEAAQSFCRTLVSDLRQADIPCDTDYLNKSLKGAMRQANDALARFCVLVGDNELAKSTVTLKDMSSKEQEEVAVSSLIPLLKDRLSK